jgi:hypothetical protein
MGVRSPREADYLGSYSLADLNSGPPTSSLLKSFSCQLLNGPLCILVPTNPSLTPNYTLDDHLSRPLALAVSHVSLLADPQPLLLMRQRYSAFSEQPLVIPC